MQILLYIELPDFVKKVKLFILIVLVFNMFPKKLKNLKNLKNGRYFMLFKIDAYFLQHNLALEIDEKILTGRDFIFEQKRQEAREKILDFDFIRINTIKEN